MTQKNSDPEYQDYQDYLEYLNHIDQQPGKPPARSAGYAAAEGLSDAVTGGLLPDSITSKTHGMIPSGGLLPTMEAKASRYAIEKLRPDVWNNVKELPEYSEEGIKQDVRNRMNQDVAEHPIAYRVGEAAPVAAMAGMEARNLVSASRIPAEYAIERFGPQATEGAVQAAPGLIQRAAPYAKALGRRGLEVIGAKTAWDWMNK